MLTVAIAGAAAAGLLVAVAARGLRVGPQQSGDLRLHRIAEDVLLYRGYFSNSAALVLPESVVVVDTQVTPRAARHLIAQLQAVTDKPIRHVVNTHHHGDHVGGNEAFVGAEILATADTAELVVTRDGDRLEYARTFGLETQGVHPVAPPTRSFRGRQSLESSGERLELIQLNGGETSDACVLWWPARGVLVAGDAVSTFGYPYLGVPFRDEGLLDDGAWIGQLKALAALEPAVLLPGHGPALVGKRAIQQRLALLSSLFTDLLETTREELRAGGSADEVLARVDRRLARYRRRADLKQNISCQRFAIYRAINSLSPERRGKGWWHGLRPSALRKASPAELQRELDGRDRQALLRRVEVVANAGQHAVALGLLEHLLEGGVRDAGLLALKASVLLRASRGLESLVDATEYVSAASTAAKEALAVDPAQPLALLTLGGIEIFSAMILGQEPAVGIRRIEVALESGQLEPAQIRIGRFLVGKGHQFAFRDDDADRWFRSALPPLLRPAYPLLREKLRATP